MLALALSIEAFAATRTFGTGAAPPDTIPDAFSFTDVTDATASTQYTSDTITVAGLGVGATAAVAITGGTYSKNGGAYTSSAGTAQNGDTFSVRQTSSASNSTATDVVLTIGGVSDTYTVTTAAAAGAFAVTGSPTTGQWGTTYSDSGITAAGGTTPYNVSGLPSGLSGSFAGGVLTISGTPE
jgi:hypothetical protein